MNFDAWAAEVETLMLSWRKTYGYLESKLPSEDPEHWRAWHLGGHSPEEAFRLEHESDWAAMPARWVEILDNEFEDALLSCRDEQAVEAAE